MRKYSLIRFIAVVVALLGITGVVMAKEGTKPQRALIASGHPEWPPVMFKEGKNMAGAGPELVSKIFADIGIQVELPYSGPWEDVLNKGKAGQIDVIVAAYKTREREEFYLYSDPYATDPIALFVPEDKTFNFKTSSDLVGKSGIGMIGDSYGQEFDDFSAAHLNLHRVQTVAEGFGLIADHKADYFIYSLYAGNLELKKSQSSRIVPLPTSVSEQKFYMIISKKSPFARYLPDVNRLIKQYKQDGTIDRLVAKYQ